MDLGLDDAIHELLPRATKILAVEHNDSSSWAATARVVTEATDGSVNEYFLKLLDTKDAADRVYGEYMAMWEIHEKLPSIAPQPYGFGKCRDGDAHFFLCDYIRIKHNELPDPSRLGLKLAELHQTSQSPTGQFGFHCTTFDGKLPLTTAWDSNWTSFFTKLIRGVYDLDVGVNRVWKELDDVMQVTTDKLIPRLLDPLTADGRTIKPCLIHSDLWESNIGTDTVTGEIYIYDACAYYAHHEKEVAIWRCEHHQMTDPVYREVYFKHYPPSEPVSEADDRNRLYSVETLLIHSAHFPGAETRRRALDELTWLVEKYKHDM